jgi:hypothetical protein
MARDSRAHRGNSGGGGNNAVVLCDACIYGIAKGRDFIPQPIASGGLSICIHRYGD